MFERKFPSSSDKPGTFGSTVSPTAEYLGDGAKSFGGEDSIREEPEEKAPGLDIPLRIKSVAGIGLLLMMLYAGSSVLGLNNSFDSINPSVKAQRLSRADLAAIKEREEFEELRKHRNVDKVKSEQGFLRRIFCSGYKRAGFCSDED